VRSTPPPLDDFVGEAIDRDELTHLFSLRNQWGQAHVNDDLTSIAWLAVPPFSGGYRTGVLRLNGAVLPCDQLKWAPWGVQRTSSAGGLRVASDTRFAYEANRVLWHVTVTNESGEPAAVEVEQELLAPIAHSEVDWGWLYGTPWNVGHQHDLHSTERIRSEVLAREPRQVQLLVNEARPIRLGRPRIPGIQRDEVTVGMTVASALPDHTTADSTRILRDSIIGRVANITLVVPGAEPVTIAGTHELTGSESELKLSDVRIVDRSVLSFDLELEITGQSGVILTHGNHPDSLQAGLSDGHPWVTIGGERLVSRSVLNRGTHLIGVRVAFSGAELIVDGEVASSTEQWWEGQRWRAEILDGVMETRDLSSPAVSTFAVTPVPDALSARGSRGQATWTRMLEPGESFEYSVALQFGIDPAVGKTSALSTITHFSTEFNSISDRWRALWINAFTPGNPDHSGYLPVFEAIDPNLSRTYYLGILLALYIRNTGVSKIGPIFLTGGPRLGPTTTFYWDISEWGRTAALLEPVGMRAWILAALAQPYGSSHSFDTRNLLPVGNHYSANDHALFSLVEHYVGVTGDLGVLDEIAAGTTVLDHLRAMAFRPRERRIAGGGVLVNFGNDPWELLECVPNYRDIVVSFNAGYVGMLRSLAAILSQRAAIAEADEAAAEAEQLAQAVLGQYAGGGRWRITHNNGSEVIGHCLDFELVAAHLAEDLPDAMRGEMIDFISDHLIDGEWMRALSPDDPIAPYSTRPDHGSAGAFAGWPGATAYGLSRLGRSDISAAFLARLHASRSGALWGQAVEAIGGGHFTVAEREASNRDSSAAVSVTEAILAGLFGLSADFVNLTSPKGDLVTHYGKLSGVRASGFDLAVPH